MQTITAIFENGVLKPTGSLCLPERTEVRITIEPLKNDQQKADKLASLESLWHISKPHSRHLTRDELHERR